MDHSDKLFNLLIDDRKRDRRWRNIRFFIIIAIVLFYTFCIMVLPDQKRKAAQNLNKKQGYVSLVRLNGEIMPDKAFSAQKVIPQLQQAFSDKNSRGVILVINSPGGSPVQASIIHDKIIELKKKYLKTVVILGVDSLASGAYLVASAGDKIFVNPDTITGFIGVVMSSFGFTDAMKKIGVARRVFTAGDNKVRMDPFEPISNASKQKINQVLEAVHQHFIADVMQGRKNKLHGDPKQLFSGDFWVGSDAVKLGLADGTGQLWGIMKSEYKVSQYRDYSTRPSLFRDIFRDIRSELVFSLEDSHLSPIKAERG